MSTHRLLLTSSGNAFSNLSVDDLLWTNPGSQSSVDSSYGPRLEELGEIADLQIDFVRIAALVFFCDRTVVRPRSWRRDISIDVAVSDPVAWEKISAQLEALLSVLTGDFWKLGFSRRREPPRRAAADPSEGDAFLLFSGGADSACGAIEKICESEVPVLISHSDWSAVRGQQNRVMEVLRNEFGVTPPNVYWRLARKYQQAGSGLNFGEEPTRRSRSVLFIALGLAAASVSSSTLLIAENGFTSLNPPLSSERRGALSTRTTHPTVLKGFAQALGDIGIHSDLSNIYADMTKGEMFRRVSEAAGGRRASDVLSATSSCAKPQREKGFAPDVHCGVCMGCLVRRAAFESSGVEDQTVYLEQVLPAARRRVWLSAKRRSAYEALQTRISRTYTESDILALGLPDDSDLDNALALVNRGLRELALVKVE